MESLKKKITLVLENLTVRQAGIQAKNNAKGHIISPFNLHHPH